jgi:hypothetical protein
MLNNWIDMPEGEDFSSFAAGVYGYDVARYMGIVPDVKYDLSYSVRDP